MQERGIVIVETSEMWLGKAFQRKQHLSYLVE